MPLPWVRLDSSFATHDKVLDLLEGKEGHRAGFVYACSLAYCGLHGTDGLVPFSALPFVHARKVDAERLVDVGLWKPDRLGWIIPNWLARQQSQAATEAALAARRRGAKRGNCVRWHGIGCGCWAEEAIDQ